MSTSGGTAPYTFTLTLDGGQLASSGATTFSWNTLGVANGGHSLGLTVRDASGTTATATRAVTVQNTRLTIWVDGAAGGNKAYTMTANGTTVWTEMTGDRPATLPWVTTNGSNGTQTLTVTVQDSSGSTGTGTITVTVANP